MSKCQYCNKSIVPIGSNRKNGKETITDWSSRKYQ